MSRILHQFATIGRSSRQSLHFHILASDWQSELFREGSSLRKTTALRPFQSCQHQRRTKVLNNLGEVWGPCRLGRTFCSSESILTPRNEAVHFTSFPTDENNFNIWPYKVQRKNEVMFFATDILSLHATGSKSCSSFHARLLK